MVSSDSDRMYQLVLNMLIHSEERKKEYWGRSEKLWKFYEAQSVCCQQLLTDYEKPYIGGSTEKKIVW